MNEKVKLTNNLGNILKTTRINNGIKSTELAQYLEKSVAYVSKLESAIFKYIDFNLLKNILKFLIKDTNKSFEDFISKTLEKYYIEETNETKEEWVIKFDTEEVLIAISKELVVFLKEQLVELDMGTDSLVEYINNNRKSELFQLKEDLNHNFLVDILDEKIIKSNYINIKEIVYSIFRLKKYSINDAIDKTKQTLNKFKFCTIKTKNKLLQDFQVQQTFSNILNEYESSSIFVYLNNILTTLGKLNSWSPDYTNKYLSQMAKSFSIKDTSFILAILGRKFYNLENLNKDNKKEFLKDIDTLINKYSKIEYDKTKNFIQY